MVKDFLFLLLLALACAGIPGLQGAVASSSSAEPSQDRPGDSGEVEATTDSAKNLLVVHALLYEVGVLANATGNETTSNETDQEQLTIYDNNGTTSVEGGPYAPLDQIIADHHLEKRSVSAPVDQLSKVESDGTDAKRAANIAKLGDVVTPLSPALAELPLPISRYNARPDDSNANVKDKASNGKN